MSPQVNEDIKKIQTLLAQEDYQSICDQYAPVLRDMLFIQSPEEWLDFIQQEGRLEEEPLGLYLSAWRGECLLLGGYHGDATRTVLDYLKDKIPAELWEKLTALNQPIILDIDESSGTLEKQISPYKNILECAGYVVYVDFEDIYYAGAYFLFIKEKQANKI